MQNLWDNGWFYTERWVKRMWNQRLAGYSTQSYSELSDSQTPPMVSNWCHAQFLSRQSEIVSTPQTEATPVASMGYTATILPPHKGHIPQLILGVVVWGGDWESILESKTPHLPQNQLPFLLFCFFGGPFVFH